MTMVWVVLSCDLAGEEEELAKLVESPNKASTAYGMEISAEKTKLMTNSTSGINKEIKVNGQKLETVTSFEYLGSVVSDESSKPKILSRVTETTAALTRLKPVWNDWSISLTSKIRLKRSIVTSMFLCACESLTLTAELQRRIRAMEMRCRILRISYKDYVTNEEVCAKIQQAIGPHEDLVTIVKRQTELFVVVDISYCICPFLYIYVYMSLSLSLCLFHLLLPLPPCFLLLFFLVGILFYFLLYMLL